MTGALTEAAKTLKKEKVVYSKHLKRKVPDVEPIYDYTTEGAADGIILYAREGRYKDVLLTGDDAGEMLDKLEAADTNWEVNVLIEPYEGVMELR